LVKHVNKLTEYDFESEVDTNILGHIFEHSLNDIENVRAQLAGEVVDKSKTKRKRDGVFYTPKYITKYIVDNTIGRLCTEKKTELEIVDEEFAEGKRGRQKKTIQKLKGKLDEYRSWLLQLTICDPACGSGAFLNQVLEFLMAEHHYVDELEALLFDTPLILPNVENHILENNIFGVDINEESVEIARLSLWLRTAKKGRKLSSLNSNIKVGNSLIDDPAVAGDLAFDWHAQFPQVFAKGGFDVVVGNPPYVDLKGMENAVVKYLFKQYKTSNNRVNLYSTFIEKSQLLLKQKGRLSFIIPSSLLTQSSYKDLRGVLLDNTIVETIVRLPNESFGGSAGEVKVDTIIISISNSTFKNEKTKIIVYKGFERINEISEYNCNISFTINQSRWKEGHDLIFKINTNLKIENLLGKIETNSKHLVECAEFCLGLTPYDKYKGHNPKDIEKRVFHSKFKKNENFKKLLAGNDVKRYFVNWGGEEWISYGPWLGAAREQRFFTEKRILVKQIIDWSEKRIWAALTEDELYNTQNAFNLIPKDGIIPEYLVAVINSKLISFYHKKKFLEEFKDRFQKILIKEAKQFPIMSIDKSSQQKFIDPVDKIISYYKERNEFIRQFVNHIISKFPIENPSSKIQNWPSLDFKGFMGELKKDKVKLSLAEEAEWMAYFNEQKAKAQDLQAKITRIDQEIDKLVYELYGLTEEEIKIVEGGAE
jgi:type I restriction-modification system DNA methylase subunit